MRNQNMVENNLRQQKEKVREMNIKEWYLETYNTDELKNQINDDVSFHELKEVISQGGDVYNLIGVGDSVIRERLFYGLADFENVEIGEIYELYEKGVMLKNWEICNRLKNH